MQYIPLSFIAGILTVFAPCVFTLLPVVLGGALGGNRWRKPLTITISLAASVFIFTLLLKASSVLINVPATFWNVVSGGIIIALGLIILFPEIWDQISARLGLQARSDAALHEAASRRDLWGDILTGAALGPVFASCSPTYAVILATILPQNFEVGVINLAVYCAAMGLVLLLISILGQKLISRLKWAVNPHGWFKRTLAIIFIIIGILIITGIDKQIETYLLDNNLFNSTSLELNFLNPMQNSTANPPSVAGAPSLNVATPYPAPDFTGSNWINSQPLHISDLKGKVVLVDFWTYSCINCIRTLPYVKQWYAKYKDEGLVIVGVHTPEFAFEKIQTNVAYFAQQNGITYPVVQDNDYAIWNAYKNNSWPAEYFIDRNGNVVNVHLGEGEYDKSEEIIQYLLGKTSFSSDLGSVVVPITAQQSPETYFNYQRGENFSNINQFKQDTVVNYTPADTLLSNYWTLGGSWKITDTDSEPATDGAILKFNFSAKDVYVVMGADKDSKVKVLINGKVVDETNKGADVDANGFVTVNRPQLYKVVSLPKFATQQEVELVFPAGVKLNTFTFGS